MKLSTLSDRALVLFSGGQDSATCLAWALSRYKVVETIGFYYGQRNVIELHIRKILLNKIRSLSDTWNVRLKEDRIVDLSVMKNISHTALTHNQDIFIRKHGLPSTFVPGRNVLFLTFASVVAYQRNLDVLIGGMCETDYSGYPDCRNNSIQALQTALNLNMDTNIKIETPLMWINKAKIWRLAYSLGGIALINLIREDTHTCYFGERNVLYNWGYGCGTCPACLLRIKGYNEYIMSEINHIEM